MVVKEAWRPLVGRGVMVLLEGWMRVMGRGNGPRRVVMCSGGGGGGKGWDMEGKK